jgi:site-specific DNA recombinase
VIDPQESPIRKRIYELFLEYRRKGAVAKTLNDSGYRTRQGSKWSDIAIGRLLRCPSAKGVYYLNRTHQLGDWKWEAKPESEWGVIQIEAIVSETLWTQCNQIMEEHTKAHRRLGPRPVQLFAGLTYCACGQKMYVKQNSPKYVCQKCKNKIPMVDLEAIFQDELEQYFAAPERIAEHLREANSNLKGKETLLEAHNKDMQKLRDDMTRTHRLYLDGNVTSQGFGEFYKPAEERLNQLVAELPKLEAEIAHMRISSLSTEEVVEEAKQLYGRWPKLPMENKRKIVESIVEKITIGDRKIDITLSYLPASEVMVTSQQAL